MLKGMQTSKVQIQANNQVWSSCFAVLVMFIFCGHFVIHFDIFVTFSVCLRLFLVYLGSVCSFFPVGGLVLFSTLALEDSLAVAGPITNPEQSLGAKFYTPPPPTPETALLGGGGVQKMGGGAYNNPVAGGSKYRPPLSGLRNANAKRRVF